MAEKISADEAAKLRGDLQEPSSDKAGGLPPEKGLEILGPDEEVFQTSAGSITVGPMKMGQIRRFLPYAEKLIPSVMRALESGATSDGAGEIGMADIFNANQEAFVQAMAVATGCTVEKLDQLTPEEYIRIATKVVVVNLDFFVRTLPMAYGRALVSLGSAFERLKAGHSQSRS